MALAGLTPLAVAQTSGDVLVLDGLALPQSHRYEIYNASSGTYSPIEVHTVPSYVPKKTRVYDRTAGVWVVDASGKLDSRYAAAAGQTATAGASSGTPGRPSGTSGKPSGEWQRIHGKIESIQGSTLKFKSDDGRELTVDVSGVASNVRGALKPDEGVTVIAHEWTGPTTVRANYVQQDSSDPKHGGKVAPSASPPTR